MAISIRHLYSNRNNRWEVKVSGEIDISSSIKLKEVVNSLIEEKKSSMVIDIEEVEYIDSTGLGTFIGIVKKIKEAGNEIILLKPRPAVTKLFAITGLDQIFVIRQES